ncbi:hypothetical protein F4825DRAFT_330408 [Nemania diffusa]|nr:hypothetical protein F4825DRAFT_330408 [Nemania diffusa]
MEKLHSQCRYTTTARSRRQKAPDGNLSEDSCHPSSDSSQSSDGGVLLRPSASHTAQNMNEITHKSDTGDDVVIPSQQFILLRSASDHTNSQKSALPWPNRGTTPIAQLGGLFNNSIGSDPPSTSEEALEISSVISGSRPSSPDHNTSIRPIKLNGSLSFRASRALTSSVPPNINGLGGGIVPIAVHGPEQREHTHHTNTTGTSSNQTSPPRQRYFAYVEDADSDDTEPRTDSLNSFAVNTGVVRDQDHRTAPGEFSLEAEQSSVSYDQGLSRPPSRVANSLSSDYPLSTYSLDGWGSEVYDDEYDMGEKQSRSISPSLRTPPSSSHQSSLSKDTNRIKIGQRPSKVYPRRILRPRRTDTPDLPLPNDPDYRSFAPTAPSSADGLSPRTYYPYGPQPGLGVPPYAPSVPAPNHEPHFAPSSPYGQYPGPDIPPGYPNYVQYQQGNPYSIPPNPDYFQPPPPLLTNIQGSPTRLYPLDPRAGKLTSQQEPENVFNSASAVNITPLYKPPVSSDPSEHDISFQIPLKKAVKLNIPCRGEMAGYWETDSSPNGPGGNSCLTRIRSLEYYADRSGQDKITILRPQLADTSALGGMGVLRWLHLQQSTLCLNDLRDLIHNCRGLDEDLKTLTDGFLKDECAKFEKKYSSGSRHGYYIEPGTVLRCDARYDHEPDKVGKSVFFCSVPYLQLGKQDQPKSTREEFDMHVHPARTLMESLYDYDLLDDRDSRQAILQRAPPEQDSILYIPQIWYILCGSDILISYSQLSFDDICKDSIQTRDESSRSLIANVTDLDNHQFSVALKTTDSFFVSLLESIMGLG